MVRPLSDPRELKQAQTWRTQRAKKGALLAGAPPNQLIQMPRKRPTKRELEKCIMMLPGYDPHRDAKGFHFDWKLAADHIDIWETQFSHVKGPLARQSYVMQPREKGIVANIFGWIDDEGLRRYRESFMTEARKNGKSYRAACLHMDFLFFSEEMGQENLCAATEVIQAGIIFDHAKGIVLQNPELEKRAKIREGFPKSIQLGRESNFSIFRVITGNKASAWGANGNCVSMDELHAFDDAGLADALETCTGAREEPFLFYITTVDYKRESICNEKQDYAQAVCDGSIRDARFLPVLHVLPPELDYKDPKNWFFANPNLDVCKSREYLKRQVEKAQRIPRYENEVRRLEFNQRTEQETKWIGVAAWEECRSGSVYDAIGLMGKRCFGGLDVAQVGDLCSFTAIFPDDGYRTLTINWTHRQAVRDREKMGKYPSFAVWEREGWLKVTPGSMINLDIVQADIIEFSNRFDLRGIVADLYEARQLIARLQGYGVMIVGSAQSYVSISPPMRSLENRIVAREIKHNGNPVQAWAIGNVAVDEDHEGRIKPNKKRSADKIDPISSLILAESAVINLSDKGADPYASHDLVVA